MKLEVELGVLNTFCVGFFLREEFKHHANGSRQANQRNVYVSPTLTTAFRPMLLLAHLYRARRPLPAVMKVVPGVNHKTVRPFMPLPTHPTDPTFQI